MLEWSKPLASWSLLEVFGCIEDPALAVPLPLDPLLHAAKADDAIARALLAKRNPVLEADRAKEVAEAVTEASARCLEQGAVQGKAQALLVVLATRGIAVEALDRGRIFDERDPGRLDRWIARATSSTSIDDVFAES